MRSCSYIMSFVKISTVKAILCISAFIKFCIFSRYLSDISFSIEHLHAIPLINCKFHKSTHSKRHTLHQGINEMLLAFLHFHLIQINLAQEMSTQLHEVTKNSMEINEVKAILIVWGINQFIATTDILCPIWVKFSIQNLNIMLLSTGSSINFLQRRSHTLLMGLKEITFLSVYHDNVYIESTEMSW